MHEPSRDCASGPPPELAAGIAEFNRGEFFECHETLEALWMAERRPVRELYQGILQVGVAFHHLRHGNYRGASGLLAKGLAHLRPFAPACLGVDVAALIADAERCQVVLAALGPARIGEFDRGLIPQVRYAAPPAGATG